jgi:hypothetical protein
MLIEFVSTLIILSFAFRIMLMIAAYPLNLITTVLITPFTRGRVGSGAGFWASLINPLFLAALYGGFIAAIAASYAAGPRVNDPLPYLVIGAVAAFFSLVSYAEGLRAKAQNRLLGSNYSDKALWIASSFSLLAGLAVFVLICLRPHYIMAVPGTDIFFRWTFDLAVWLSGYQYVQLILAVGILGYILYVFVRTAVNVCRLGFGALKRQFQRLRWWLKPAPAAEQEQQEPSEEV